MKTGALSLFAFICNINLFAQKEPSDYFTQIFPCLTGRKVIIVKCNRHREVDCAFWVISTKLFDVPFKCDKYVELPELHNIQWESYGNKIFNTRIIGGFTDGGTYVSSNIEIYDTNGLIFDTITFASSPLSEFGKLYFCREFDKENNTYCPQLFEYDLETKEENLIHRFDSIYTFWHEQYDCIDFPEIKFNTTYPSGIVCILYSKDNPESIHTALVNCIWGLFYGKKDIILIA